MNSTVRRVGNNSATYIDLRNINLLPFKRYRFKRVYDFFNIPNAISYRFLNKISNFLKFLHYDCGIRQADILHFCNTISLGTVPWVVTLESAIPRWNHTSRFGMRLLAGKYCKKLIAISQNAFDVQRHYLSYFPEYEQDVLRKMCVIHPPQRLLIRHYSEKELEKEFLVFTIIGHDFFYKGGKEVLNVFERLLKAGHPLKLNIISNLNFGDYASKTTLEDWKIAKRIISNFPGHIFHYPRLPNDQVLSLLRKTHVGLLPSYADPYGYSVLEAQASGCPVITTDIRAFPETNEDDFGWRISVPKNELGYGIIETESDRARFSKILEEGLCNVITEIARRPEWIKQKGVKCLERIKERHNADRVAEQVENIYDEALS